MFNKYRSVQELRSFSGTFDLISFEAVDFEFIVEKVWLGLDRRFGQTDIYALVCLIKFGLISLADSSEKQTN